MSDKFIAREDANEGRIFYDNKLNTDENVSTYFPQTNGESYLQYGQRPKISMPIAGSIVDRVVNIMHTNMQLTASDVLSQTLLDEMVEALNLDEFIREMVVNAIIGGNNLTVIRAGWDYPKPENWDGTFVNFDYIGSGMVGYDYTIDNGIIVPVYSDDVDEKDVISVFIDEWQWDEMIHGYGFTPAVVTRFVDMYSDGNYGKSYINRYKELVIEYNQTVSQMMRAIKIFQNVWNSNLSMENPENPISLTPDKINFLGPEGTLEQAAKNLNLNEEVRMLEILEHHIAKASQVPAELAGLRGVGKLPSGVALTILLQPLTELVSRLRPIYNLKIEELAEKLIKAKYLMMGKQPPQDLSVAVTSNETLFPQDRTARIDEIVLLKEKGLINDATAKLLIEPLIGINKD